MTGRTWAYIGTFLGAAFSVAANVEHSYIPPDKAPADWSPHVGAVAMSVFWPVAVLVALEIMARVNWPDHWRSHAIRWAGLTPVALVAAVVSYRHLSGLLDWYGEDDITTTIGPLAVDGLMILGSGALLVRSIHAAIEATPLPAADDVASTDPILAETVVVPITGEPQFSEQDRPYLDWAPDGVNEEIHEPDVPEQPEVTKDDPDHVLIEDIRAAIARGELPAAPSGNKIRMRYAINYTRAARLLAALDPPEGIALP